jgi:glyceraldehyde 3-phosphate dehydrogenase
VVVESTGKFTRKQDALQHVKAGAKQVILSTYPQGSHAFCPLAGVNSLTKPDATFMTHASCTTTAIAPVLTVLRKRVGIKAASLFGVQSVTHSQTLVDKTRGQGRRRRSALQNIIPVEVDATSAVPALIPGLRGKFIASAARVPSPIVHLAVLHIIAKKKVTVDIINQIFLAAEKSSALRGIIATTTEPVVSQDLKQHPASGIVDLNLTQVAAGTLVQIGVWYDNEWAFSQRLVDLLENIAVSRGAKAR